MIFVILILNVLSPAFTFPVTDQTPIKTEQDPFHQISVDTRVPSYGEKIKIQKLQFIDQKQNVQPIVEVDSNHEKEVDQVQSTVDQERSKIYLKPSHQISKVSDSVQKFQNVQLIQLEPVTSDIIIVSNLQQPVLLPFIRTNQIQPLSVTPIKQGPIINQSPPIAAEVTNLVIIPAFEPIDQKNTPIVFSAESLNSNTPSIQSPEIPQTQLNIFQSNVGQAIGESFENQKQLTTIKSQNVNNPQTAQLNEKDIKEKAEEKQNIDESVKSQIQAISNPQNTNVDHSQVTTNSEPEIKTDHQLQKNQDQSVAPTQYDNVPEVLAVKIPYQQKVQSEITAHIEEQTNQRQFDIKEEIEKVQAEVQHEAISSDLIEEQLSQNYPYQESSQIHHIQTVEAF